MENIDEVKKGLSFTKIGIFIVGFSLAMFHILTSFFGALPAYNHRVVHLTLSLLLVPLCFPFQLKNKKINLCIKIVLLVIIAFIGMYAYSIADIMWKQSGIITSKDMILGTILVILILFYTWKIVGPALPIIAMLTMVYAYFGPYLPSSIAHRGYGWDRIIELLFKGTNGIFGTALGVSAIYVSIFIIFAALLESSGAGDVFIKLTQSLLGGFRGGPAKVAVVASSLFGTISGSAVANVVGTGSFTIPLMKKTGFKGEFSAAVETAASSGGQLMPPVMGAAAFIMADIIGSYKEVIIAGIIPAILYYIALFMMIDIEAMKQNLRGQSKSELPNFKEEFTKRGYLLIPLAVLIILLVVVRYSAQKAAFFSICLLILICLFFPGRRQKLTKVLNHIANSSKGMITVALTTATAGIIIGMLMLTGIGYKLSSLLVAGSHGNVYLLLIFTMLTSVILGMGMPTSAAYILLATLIVPALTDLGIVKIAAHFFVFYFGIMANVTPPVAIAAYTAAGIAESDSMKTGLTAWRLSLAGFLLPFMFCINPSLLGQGGIVKIGIAVVTALIGSFALASAVQRYFFEKLSWIKTILLLIGSISMMTPGSKTDIVGILLIGSIFIIQILRTRESKNITAG